MNNMDDYGKPPKISFSEEEKGGLVSADALLAILIPAVGECYRYWNPVNTRMNHRTFYTYFSRNMDFVPKVYQSQRQGHVFDFSVLDKVDVPHIKDTVPTLAAAIEQCRSIWTEADSRLFPFLNMMIHFMYTIANKMHSTGMKAAGLMYDFDIDFIVGGETRTLSFSEEEGTPSVRPVLAILIPVAQKCYTFLNPAKPGMSERTCMLHFVQSIDCAFQVIQHRQREGEVDLGALCAKIEIPHIEDMLPLLVTALEKCCLIWVEAEFDYLGRAMFIIGLIGAEMYPNGMEDGSIGGFPDIFVDSGESRGSLTDVTVEFADFPNAEAIIPILMPAVQKCYALWKPWESGLDESIFLIRFASIMDAVAEVYEQGRQGGNEVDLSFLAEMDVPYVEEIVSLFVLAFEQCRAIWSVNDYDYTTFVNKVMNYMQRIGLKLYQSGQA